MHTSDSMDRCRACSAEMPSGSRFCPSCGEPLGSASATPTRMRAGEPGRAAGAGSWSSSSSVDSGRFEPGTLLGGRYRILGRLGRGGMGEVYRADDMKLAQPVALKFLPPDLSGQPSMLARFHHEVRIARQVSHPNVCRVYDIGEVEGQHYISMEYVDGEDLRSLLRRIGRLPGDKAVQIARQLCAGLAAAHDKGVLHRDLKPANVMLDGEGRVRITDFGLAAIAGEVTGAEVHAGTPAYMAPEQLAGREVSVASDLFSLGLVLFELFTGRPVFNAASPAELARQHQLDRTSPSSLVTDLDPAVERVILRCLSRHPAERPASALAVAAALPGGDPLAAALAAGETPSPEMVAAAGETGGLTPRSAWLALAGVVILLVPLVALTGKVNIAGRTPMPKSPQVLMAEARALLKEAGYVAPPADTMWGFKQNEAWLAELEKSGSAGAWDRLGPGPRSGLVFWYRESPNPLVPLDLTSYRMSVDDPPQTAPGVAAVWLDPSGSLLRLQVVPPERDEPAAAGAAPPAPAPSPLAPLVPPLVQWTRLIDASGLREADLRSAAPAWNPPFHADERKAWIVPADGGGEKDLRLEAASYRGRPVFYRVIGPWERPAESAADPQTAGQRAGRIAGFVLLLAILLASFLLARRNVRLGRSDRNGALRIAGVFITVHMAGWLFWGIYFADAGAMFAGFMQTLAATLFEGVMLYALYLALEPFVRRRWPESLISWTRVLAGRLRDPLVGRDLLLGCLLGVATAALAELPRWIGIDPRRPFEIPLQSLTGPRHLIGEFLDGQIHSLVPPMLLLVLLLLFGVALRRVVWAAGAVMVLMGLIGWAAGRHWLDPLGLLLFVGIMLLSLTRLGLLATTVLVASQRALDFAITYDVASWLGAGTLLAVAWVVAIAGYGFHAALAGRPLLPEAFLRE